MSKEIIDRYNSLSKNKINSVNDVITSEGMSSLVRDRFRSSLLRLGYEWKGETISINDLVSNESQLIDTKIQTASKEKNIREDGNVGIDIQNVGDLPDFEDVWLSDFYSKNFSDSEIAHCLKLDNPKESFAGIFSAKESIIKALGADTFSEKGDILIEHDGAGAPIHHDFFISISHDNGFAISVAIKKKSNGKDNGVEINGVFNEVSDDCKSEINIAKGVNLNFLLFILQLIVIAIFLAPKLMAFFR